MSPDELVGHVARHLEAPWFERLVAVAAREAREAKDAASRLDAARAQVSLVDAFRASSDAVHRVDGLESALAREQREASVAFEEAWAAILRSFAVLPPLGVQWAALATRAVVDQLGRGEIMLAMAPSGRMLGRPGGAHRALLLAALGELRASCWRAFPELAPAPEGGPIPTPAEERLVDDVRALAARYVAHSYVLSALRRAAEEAPARGLLDRLALRSPAGAGEVHTARATWHAALLPPLRRAILARCIDPARPGTILHEAIGQAQAAAVAIRRVGKNPSRLVGKEEARAAVDVLVRVVGDGIGVHASADAMAAMVHARLEGRGPPGPAAIEALARDLGAGLFRNAMRAVHAATRRWHERKVAAEAAADEVSWVDRLNILWSTDEEKRAVVLAEQVEDEAGEMRDAVVEARRHFYAALVAHPALVLYLALHDVAGSIAALTTMDASGYEPDRAGLLAVGWLATWSAAAAPVFGAFLPPDETLERILVASLLAESPGRRLAPRSRPL